MVKLFYKNRNNSTKMLNIINIDWEVSRKNVTNCVFHANSFTVYVAPSKEFNLEFSDALSQ